MLTIWGAILAFVKSYYNVNKNFVTKNINCQAKINPNSHIKIL